MNKSRIFALLLTLCLAGSGGCRKDLCYDHDRHGLTTRAWLYPQWEQEWERDYGMAWEENWPDKYGIEYDLLRPDIATGIATAVYHDDGSRTERHLPAEGGELPMSEGEKSILLYNNDTRYILFSDLGSSAMASASTRTRLRTLYNSTHAEERTVNAPDMLYGAWIESYTAAPTAEPDSLGVVLRPLVYTYLIRYEFDSGLEHVTLARGALSGMAQSVYLQDGRTSDDTATILFDCELKDYGAETQLTSFGVPGFASEHYTQRASQQQTLNLEVLLKNGKLKTFEIDVSDQLTTQPRGGVITVSGLTVTDDEAGGDAGFDVDVEGWGEYEDIVLPLD